MSTNEHNKALLRMWFEQVVNPDNVEHIDDFATPEFAALYREQNQRIRATFPDVQMTIHEVTAEDDRVSIVWEANATHQGRWRGVPANVKPVTWRGLSLYYMQDGKIAEEITAWNRLDMYEQLVGLPDWFVNHA